MKLYDFEESFVVALREYTSEETKGSYDTDGLNIFDFSTETFNMNSYIAGNKISEHHYIFGYTNRMSGLLYLEEGKRVYNCRNYDGKLFIAFVTTKHHKISDEIYGFKATVNKVIFYGSDNSYRLGEHNYPVFAGDHIEFYRAHQSYTEKQTDIPDCIWEDKTKTRYVWGKPFISKMHEDVVIDFNDNKEVK